ncbi:hypothetical protein LTR85_002912 [Meristemomyces frigidus]|nr:hypothetical protein LTR85_002912 [Meristemomyces frigidus]
MPDPLTIATSVVGLINGGASMITTLYNIGSAIKDAPHLTRAVADELANITIVLQQLQTYVLGKAQASIQRLNLITIEHITATISGCVLTYSELDGVLKSLNAESGIGAWDRGMWYLKKTKVYEIVQRLQNHKGTLGLMLNIIQCASLSEAETSMDRLCDAVNEVLRTNQELSMRLRNIEELHTGPQTGPAVPSAGPDASSLSPESDQGSDSGGEPIASSGDQVRAPHEHSGGLGDGGRQSNFEELLHRSRVYRNVDPGDTTPSLMSDARSTLALSICSSLTLGEVSNISVYAIPIYAQDLSNASCYRFGPPQTQTVEAQAVVQGEENQPALLKTPQKRQWRTLFKRSPRRQIADVVDVVPAAESGIFGVRLGESIRYANVAISLFNEDGTSYIYGYLPIVVTKCGVFLKEKGTDVEYIFATSPNLRHLRELIAAFNMPPKYGKGLSWEGPEGYTVHDAANVLLRYLLQLPEPLVPLEFYDRFCQPLRNHESQAVGGIEGQEIDVGSFDVEAAVSTYNTLVHEIPPLNRQLLLYILDVLAVFASKSEINKMTVVQLAALFQPGILAHPQHALSVEELNLSHAVLIFLIERQDDLLVVEAPPSTAELVSAHHVRSSTATKEHRMKTDHDENVGAAPIGKQGNVRRNVSGTTRGAASIEEDGNIRRSASVPSRPSGSTDMVATEFSVQA